MKRSLFTLLFFTTLLPLSAEASLFKYCASHLLGTPEVHAVIPPVVSEDERALVENFISSDYFYEQFLNEQFEDSIPDGSIKSPSWELLDRIALNLVYRIENKMTENLIQYMRFVIREAVVGPMLEEYSRVLGNRKGSHTITKILSTPFLGRGFDVLTSPPLRPLAQYRKHVVRDLTTAAANPVSHQI